MSAAEDAVLTAIASLPGVGPNRLRVLLEVDAPDAVWSRIRRGTLGSVPEVVHGLGTRSESLLASWRSAAGSLDPDALLEHQRSLGIRLIRPSDPGYPAAFRDDIEPPVLLWVRGAPDRVRTPTVAVVGTRRCTRYGHDVARRFGRELAEAGVSVVSGLALGIDAAAHAGALDVAGGAAPVGVVGTGLDVVYPRRNRMLWNAVGDRGVLFSEAPPGARAEPWRFPARNRLIAALADLVVVVESTEKGGSLYTVDEAMARDTAVCAVPGPITSPASAGTNRLLADGAMPALDTSDLLGCLGIDDARGADPPTSLREEYRDPAERAVLDVVTTGAVTFDELAERSGLSLERLGVVAAKLQIEGLLCRSGGWYEQRG